MGAGRHCLLGGDQPRRDPRRRLQDVSLLELVGRRPLDQRRLQLRNQEAPLERLRFVDERRAHA
eukprot:3423192-Prymnesium_polylepis.1